jgi:hypothetical protein
MERAMIKDETRKESLRRLFQEFNMCDEDFFRDPRGFITITRSGIDRIVNGSKMDVAYEEVVMDKEWVVIKCYVKTPDGLRSESYGEASEDNTKPMNWKWKVAMAQKRACSRAVLHLAGFYELGVMGVDEVESEVGAPQSDI